ncbi:conserved hypothetical protein [Desulfofarcimen acetoxidans DSM 771]|jgi:hypothetical protein|uniref:DUF3243 domain-containing protein n=1 Tax=Desulfofarcimen acetoxidans (strain ATCC 49208 / DSM 771 / KCTC 5769 / VKM B-1644 / 5575) TaxID=485916 RepID=C8W6H0_DESAS|nr:DUF3243 domain-containing protein [Desulfofarcimen acetoxidans]ACV62259.1 conserved hypothetical protein [Desulfofarcimen acetoxidans DSM 771]
MEIDVSWNGWKKMLGRAVDAVESIGASEDTIDSAAYHVGNFLSKNVDPANREQCLLKEMWDEAGSQERRVIASVVVRLADKEDRGNL